MGGVLHLPESIPLIRLGANPAPIIARMLDLARTVRFCLNDAADPAARDNSFAAWPAMRGLGRYYELGVRCRGRADAVTGYFINIREIDEAVRRCALPLFRKCLAEHGGDDAPLGRLLADVLHAVGPDLGHTVVSVQLRLTPFHSLAMESHDMSHVLLRQQFEFAAAHRLHVPELSDEENRRVFGKCNNPSGHGHNYRLEVVARVPVGPHGGVMRVEELDALVNRVVIEPLDHKNLSVDVPAFEHRNASVENIAQVIYGMLAGPLADAGAGLDEVSVWETSKTVCTYRGEPVPAAGA